MCFYYDGVCEIYEESIHRARKPHKCCSCRREIEPGEQYLSVFSVYKGMADNRKVCNQCVQDSIAIERHENMGGCYGMEAMPPWEDVHWLIQRGNRDEGPLEELDTDSLYDFCEPVLFWPYGVPPACHSVDLKTVPRYAKSR